MNVKTMKMSKAEAAKKVEAYRAALARRGDNEYEQALTVYEALEQGLTVIDAAAAIREGGFDDKMRPKLAIARADREQVCFRWPGHSDTATFDTSAERAYSRRELLIETINFNRRHGYTNGKQYEVDVKGFALVPMIPADARPYGNEKNWHILWEVEQWADERIGVEADRDPYLLRRLAGDLFVILAEWDLTEVERLVTQGRARLQR